VPQRYPEVDNHSLGIVPGLPHFSCPGPVPQMSAYHPLSGSQSRSEVEAYNRELKQHRRSLGGLPTGKVTSVMPTGDRTPENKKQRDARREVYQAWSNSPREVVGKLDIANGDRYAGSEDSCDVGGPKLGARGVPASELACPPSPPDNRGRQGRSKSPIKWSPRRQTDEYNLEHTKPRQLIGGKLRAVEELTCKVTQTNPTCCTPRQGQHYDSGTYSPRRRKSLDPEIEQERLRLEKLAMDVEHKKELSVVKRKETQRDLKQSWDQQIHMQAEAKRQQADYSKSWPYGPHR